MYITCDACNKQTEARITESAPHKVICEHCGQQVRAVTDFVIRQLIHSKSFIKTTPPTLSTACGICQTIRPVILKKDNQNRLKPYCLVCGNHMQNVTSHMLKQMKIFAETNATK